MNTTPTARLIVTGTQVKAFVPYDHRTIAKSFPGRKWDPIAKAWLLPLAYVDGLADALRAVGVTVFVTTPDGSPWTQGGTRHGVRDTPTQGWADVVLDAVGPERSDFIYRALSKVLHPDTRTGDPRLMQELNAARARVVPNRIGGAR